MSDRQIPDDLKMSIRTLFQQWLNGFGRSAEHLAQDAALAERQRCTALVSELMDDDRDRVTALRSLLYSIEAGHQPDEAIP